MPSPQQAGIHRYEAILLVAACLLFGVGLGTLDFWAPDEPRYAAIAEELRASRHGIEGALLLRLNDVPYTQKPPLYFWLAAAAGAPAGHVGPIAARLPSALAGVGCIALLLFIGRRLASHPRLALIAAAVLATSFRFGWTARRAQLDVLLTLFELIAIAIFVALEFRLGRTSAGRTPPSAGQVALLHFVLGLGAMTKGPVAWMPLLILIAWFAWEGRIRDLRAYCPLWAWTLSIGPVAAWIGVAVALAPPGFADVAVYENLIDRFFSGTSHARPFYYFLYQTPADFLPWTPLFLLGAVQLRRSLASNESGGAGPEPTSTVDRSAARFLIAWLAIPFLFFSLSAGKRGVYLLPVFPALALGAALGLERLIEWRPRHFRPTRIAGLFVAVAGVELAILTLVLPRLEDEKSARPIARAVAHEAAPDERVAVFGLEPIEGALRYYADVSVTSISGTAGRAGLETFFAKGGRLVLLRARHFEAFAEPLALSHLADFRAPPRRLVLAERRAGPRTRLDVPDPPGQPFAPETDNPSRSTPGRIEDP